jgi:glycerol-3-phosphate O-acyltransferase/dihydroxyacetone phosphate acyltransferase
MAALAAPDPTDRFYALVRLVGRFWLWFFFRSVEVHHVERVPGRGPVLLCINHPNNLIDSLLVGAVLTRKVHYLATAALFRNPLVARFLTACGAIPVYRRQDDPDKMDKNADTFAACFRALGQGRLIGIYPEGTTHAETRVQRIKTGASRIALEYETRRASPSQGEPRPWQGEAQPEASRVFGSEKARSAPSRADLKSEPVAVIPVGLTFEARKSFRGRVRVSFGEPVPVTPYLDAYREDSVKAVDALTTAIQWGMEAEILHVERIDRDGLIRALDELFRSELVRELQEERGLGSSQIDTFRLSRAIAEAVAYFEAREPERVERLAGRITHYRAMLAAYRVRDQAVRARLEHLSVRRRILRSWEASLGLPFFAYGLAVNALPYLVPRWLARRTAQKETDYATTRLLASIVAFPLFWGLEVWLVWRLTTAAWAALFALSLPLSGLVAYRYLGGVGRLRNQIGFGLLALTRRQSASRLLAERRALIAEIEAAKTDFLSATKGSSF